jgi:hypothetical protein
MQPFSDLFGRMVIGEQEFHRGESRLRRRIEAVEERDFGEHHREIGGETGHRLSFCLISISVRPAAVYR